MLRTRIGLAGKVLAFTFIVLMHADVAKYGQNSTFAAVIAIPGMVIDAIREAT